MRIKSRGALLTRGITGIALALAMTACNVNHKSASSKSNTPPAASKKVTRLDGGDISSSSISDSISSSSIGGDFGDGDSISSSSIGGDFGDGDAISSTSIGGDTIGGSGISDNSIGGSGISDNSIGGSGISDNSIGGSSISDNSIGGSSISDNSIGGTSISNSSIGSTSISNSSIGSTSISNSSIGGTSISGGSTSSSSISGTSISSGSTRSSSISGTSISGGSTRSTSISSTGQPAPVIPGGNISGCYRLSNEAFYANGSGRYCRVLVEKIQTLCRVNGYDQLYTRFDYAGDRFDGDCGAPPPLGELSVSGSIAPGQHFLAVGPGEGQADAVRIFDTNNPANPVMLVWPYGQQYNGGVRVALADVDGDGTVDLIAGTGKAYVGRFVVISGRTGQKLMDQTPFNAGGIYVAAGNMLGDGRANVLVGAGTGQQPRVLVYNLAQQVVRDLQIYESTYTLGVRVAVGDVNGDGRMDIITSTPPGGGPRVRVIDALSQQGLADAFVYEDSFRGGVWISAVQVDGTGKASIVVGADEGGGPRVRVLNIVNGQYTASQDFFAYDSAFRGGVRVSALDKDANGRGQLVLAPGVGGGPQIRIVSAQNPAIDFGSFWGADPNLRTGFYVSGATPISRN